MEKQAKNISIIIVHYFDPGDLETCVQSIAGAMQDLEGEIIVVDNSPEREIGTDFFRSAPDITIIHSERNLGFAGACNLAARRAEGDFLLFLNPDARPAADTVRVLMEFINDNPGVAAVSPVLTDEDGCVTSTGEKFPGFRLLVADTLLAVLRIIPRKWIDPNGRRRRKYIPSATLSASPIDWIPAACLLVRREAWASVGGFDPHFFLYGEDKDLCLRLKKKGWAVYCLLSEGVVHLGDRSGSHNPESLLHFHRSQNYFFRMHYPFPVLLGGTLIFFTRALLLALRSLFLMIAGREEGRTRWRQCRGVLSWYLTHPGEILGGRTE